jgi:hypothetical protein
MQWNQSILSFFPLAGIFFLLVQRVQKRIVTFEKKGLVLRLAPTFPLRKKKTLLTQKKPNMLLLLILVVCLLVLVYIGLCVLSYCQSEINIHDRVLKEREKIREQLQNNNLTIIQDEIVLLCAARDAMHGLPTSLENIRNFKMVCPNLRCVFVENDSMDNTRDFIETEFPKILPTKILQGDVSGHKYTATGKGATRLRRMIALRNQLIDEVKPSDKFFVVYDVDWKVVVPIEGFYKALQKLRTSPTLQAVCPLLLRPLRWLPFRNCYFDTFAFQDDKTASMTHAQKIKYLKWKRWYKRSEKKSKNDKNESDKNESDKNENDTKKSDEKERGDFVDGHMKEEEKLKEEEKYREEEKENEEGIPVSSAFGCLAVYKNRIRDLSSPCLIPVAPSPSSSLHEFQRQMPEVSVETQTSSTKLPRYSLSFNQAGEAECEHVQFNKQMGSMVILPQWEILA